MTAHFHGLLRVALLLVLILANPAVAARAVTSPIAEYVSQVRAFMPQEGSGAYVVPTEQERSSFAAAAKALTSGDLATAEEALAAFPGFEVLSLTDGADGPLYLVIAEKPPLSRGWGFYFFARQPLRPGLVVEAPHPLADRDSELAAARAVSSLRPAAFLLAGAHRYADPAPKSDMAHTSSSIFEAIHEVVSTQAGMVVQVHGFSAAGHQGYPDLLLSSGSAEPGATAEAVCNQVQGGGVGCTLFNGDPTYAALGATTNVQGGYSRRTFGAEHFLHFETAETVRDDPAAFDVIVAAIASRWPVARGCGCGGLDGPLCWLTLFAFSIRPRRGGTTKRFNS